MIAIVYTTDHSGKQVEIGRLQLENGVVVQVDGSDPIVGMIQQRDLPDGQGNMLGLSDGEKFLRLLPGAYSGTRLRVGLEDMKETKGDLPGHPFRGNQWSGGRSGGLRRDLMEARGYGSEVDADADFSVVKDEYDSVVDRIPAVAEIKVSKLVLSNTEFFSAPGTGQDSFGYADEEHGIIGLATGGRAINNESAPLLDVTLVDSSGLGAFRHELGHLVYAKLNNISENARYEWEDRAPGWIEDGTAHAVSRYGASRPTELFAEAFSAYSHRDYGTDERLPKEIEEFFDRTLKKR